MLIFPPQAKDFKFPEAKSPRLHITSFSSAAFTLILRGVTKTGLIHDTWPTNGTRLAQVRDIPLTEIPLCINLSTSTALVQRGRLYVEIQLQFAGVTAVTLAADYITTNTPLTWPGNQIHSATEGRGYIHTITGTDPAAGNEIDEAVPINTLWHIHAVYYTLVTSVVAAIRTSRIYITPGAALAGYTITPNATQIASLTRHYLWYPFNNIPAAFNDHIYGELPPIPMATGAEFTTETDLIDAGDNYGAPEILVEEWLNP